MNLIPVQSSAFTHIGYDTERRVLCIQFNSGDQFEYANVSPRLWSLIDSVIKQDQVSLGSVFHWTIKAHPAVYPFTRLTEKHDANSMVGS